MLDNQVVAFKQLTANNWDEPDETSAVFHRVSPVVGLIQMNANDWARAFLAVELDPAVPRDIQDLFAAARGVLLYGWFFYPLYALGSDQLHRVVDAATALRYRELAGPLPKNGHLPPFARRVRWLIDNGAIGPAAQHRWQAFRELRNNGSHPDFQSLHTPGDALVSLGAVAECVNALFARAAIGPGSAQPARR